MEVPIPPILERKPYLVSGTVYCFLVVQSMLLAWSAYERSPVSIEVGELAAGHYHLTTGRFNTAVVNPPLVRCLAAAPLVLIDPKFDFRAQSFPPHGRTERFLAQRFMALNGPSVFRWLIVARWICISFAFLGGYTSARWAGELYGSASANLAAGLWAFSPWILGHGGPLTTDVPAASTGIAAAYLLWRGIANYDNSHSIAAGLLLGVALLTKFTMIVLVLILLLWISTVFFRECDFRRRLDCLKYIATASTVALLLVNTGYGFEGSGTQLGAFRFVSSMFGGTERQLHEDCGNRFSESIFGDLPVPLPEHFLIGIDVQRRDFERGLASYAAGQWSERGWWWYYLYVLLLKTPLGLIGLFVWSACSGWRGVKGGALLLAGGFILLFGFVSFQSGFSTHGRYLIPSLPFLLIGCSSVVKYSAGYTTWRDRCAYILFTAAALESLSCYPHSLSYFNVLAGGPMHGYQYLADSNISWGQDLFLLKQWLDSHPEVSDLRLLHFGGVNPALVDVRFRLPCPADIIHDTQESGSRLKPGWYAVDVNYLAGSNAPPIDTAGEHNFSVVGLYSWSTLVDIPEYDNVGYSIRIYRISDEQTRRDNRVITRRRRLLSSPQKRVQVGSERVE